METRANYVLVGFFTVLVILAAFGFVYWSANIGDRGETAVLRFRIPGSASGLSRGSAVLFNGVKVGDVRAEADIPCALHLQPALQQCPCGAVQTG